jgi:predicted acetyltransferase
MELYLYDFTDFDRAEIGPDGLYGYSYLDNYWAEPDRYPFLLHLNGCLAGFVLVCKYNYLSAERDCWVIAEFFILRKYRRQGLGTQAAAAIFDRFPGPWQVGQIPENTPATAFWRKVIGRYTGGRFQEISLDNENWRGPVQLFHSPPCLEDSQAQ